MLKWHVQDSTLLFNPSKGDGHGGRVMATSYTRIACSELSEPNIKRIYFPKALVGIVCPFLNQVLCLETWLFRSGFITCPFGGGRRWLSLICYGIDQSSLPAAYTQDIILLEKAGNGFWANKTRRYYIHHLLYSSPLTSNHIAILFLIHINIELFHLV